VGERERRGRMVAVSLPMDPQRVRKELKKMADNWASARELLREWERQGPSKWGLGVAMDVRTLMLRLDLLEAAGASHPAGRHSLPLSGDEKAPPRDVPRPDTKGKATSGPGVFFAEQMEQIEAVRWCYNRAAKAASMEGQSTIQDGIPIPKAISRLLSRLYAELSEAMVTENE